MVGAGVWGRGEKEAHEGVVVATTASHTSAAVEDALQSIKGDKVMRVGGAGYKGTYDFAFILLLSTFLRFFSFFSSFLFFFFSFICFFLFVFSFFVPATILIISTAMLVLEGIADVYVFPKEGCKLWDTCAPHALLLAAGGTYIFSYTLPSSRPLALSPSHPLTLSPSHPLTLSPSHAGNGKADSSSFFSFHREHDGFHWRRDHLWNRCGLARSQRSACHYARSWEVC